MKEISKKYLAEFVYGATDGTVTTFAIIAGVMGAGLAPLVVLILGISNVLADGFSMAASNYLSERSDEALGNINLKSPTKTALVTFVSFVCVGLIPLLSFVVSFFTPEIEPYQFEISIVLTGLAFVVIGAIRGKVTGKSGFRTSTETLFVGGVAAGIAYIVGFMLKNIM